MILAKVERVHKRNIVLFIVLGRLCMSLSVSKVLPCTLTGLFDEIYVFREEESYSISGIKYITLPAIIRNLRPTLLKKIVRLLYEPFQLTLLDTFRLI